MKPIRKRRHQRGAVLVLTVILLTVLLFATATIARRVIHQSDSTGRIVHEIQVFYCADGGTEVAERWLRDLVQVSPYPTQTELNAFAAPSTPDYQFIGLTITKQPFQTDYMIPNGPFAGCFADIQPYAIQSHATNHNASVEKIVTVTVHQQSINLGQFGIYYDDDLEIFPLYPLDYKGRIHTNGNLYVGSSNVLNLDADVTVAGHIYNTPKDETQTYLGKARFANRTGVWEEMWRDLDYDSRHPDWIVKSLDDWDGRVQDSDHYASSLPLPLPTPANPIDIIKRGLPGDGAELLETRFYYKAGLLIVDGVVMDSGGTSVITLPAGILTSTSVYDCREQTYMNMYDLDVAALIAASLVPANGVIYFSESTTDAALRLLNAASLPAGGLTIATDNPCYVRGHYNTVNKQPASILCDAFNVYSSIWDDSNADQNLNKRLARQTTVNTCVVTGNTLTTNGNYNGGAENLVRLHEKWVGHALTYRGSLVCIWQSQQATGAFSHQCYEEAHRDWGFDQDLLDPNYWPDDFFTVGRVVRARWESN